MQDDPDTPDSAIAHALEAWAPLAPPADFADRVLAARSAAPQRPAPPRRARRIGGIVLAGAAAAAAVLALHAPHRAASGSVIAAQRTTTVLGDRGIAVAEPATELAWRVADSGDAEITQRGGNVFYRVERGGPFVVHTPAGDVRVTGTCFRIEVQTMTPNQKLLIAGLAGAATASIVLITVYEGHVIAETRAARTELAAGSQATLRSADSSIVAGAAVATSTDDVRATRDQLLARTHLQQAELHQLRARVAQLEKTASGPEGLWKDVPEPGRVWHDPSPERLAEWVATCHVRVDEPGLDRFTPLTRPDNDRGIAADDLGDYNAALTEVQKQWKELTRSLYIEITGDTVGADSLSNEAMRREIEDKSPRGEINAIYQRISQERAGLVAPPADLSRASQLERLTRAWIQLGDQSEAALARRLGADRAHAIRGEGWGAHFEAGGCPDATSSP
jgi:hypothetical protein